MKNIRDNYLIPDMCRLCRNKKCNLVSKLKEFNEEIDPEIIDKYCSLNIGSKSKDYFIKGE